jgi:biopolymer transport protein ExbD
MAITFNKSRNDDDALMAEINTTPLVDVMLVLLIIFLITIPAVTTSIQVKLPKEINQIRQTQTENIIISVTDAGNAYWFDSKLSTFQELKGKLLALKKPMDSLEVHIRGDANANYETIGQVVYVLQESGVTRIGFITQPPAKN